MLLSDAYRDDRRQDSIRSGKILRPLAVARASAPRGPVPVGRSLWRVPTIVELGQFLNWKVGVPSSAFQGLAFVGGCDQDRRLGIGIRGGLEHSMGEPGDP